MKLTRNERMGFANQYRILALLDPASAEHWQRRREAFECGYEAHYADDTVDPDVLTEAQSSEVVDILSLFTAIAWSHDDLGDAAGIDAARVRFPGFDRNTESLLLGYVTYQVTLGSFARLQEQRPRRSLACPIPMLSAYRRMLPVWQAMGCPQQHLSVAQMTTLLDAMEATR